MNHEESTRKGFEERIARALERIADALESTDRLDRDRPLASDELGTDTRPRRSRRKDPGPGSNAAVVVDPVSGNGRTVLAAYCDAYRERYGTNPLITGKDAGLVKNLLRTIPPDRLSKLAQAYVQMKDKWFETKCHDFATFATNIQRVAVALFHGTADPHEKNYWAEVFGGKPDAAGSLPAADNAPREELGGAQLQGGKGQPLLEGF